MSNLSGLQKNDERNAGDPSMKLNDLKEYRQKYIMFEEIRLTKFEKIEMLLFLVSYLKIQGEINNYYLLLGGRGLLSRSSFTKKDYLSQNARIHLKTLNQKKVYLDHLKEYENCDEKIKLYKRQNGKYVKLSNLPKRIEERESLYLKLLSLEIRYQVTKPNYAFKDKKRYGIIMDDRPIELNPPFSPAEPIKITKPKKKRKETLKLPIQKLIDEANRQDEMLSESGKPFRKRIIQNSTFKKNEDGKLIDVNEIVLNGIVNIAGQVGSGKSTFSDAAVPYLASNNKKIVIIEPTVNKVLEKCEIYTSLGVKVVPVIGASNWMSHINKSFEGKDFLNDYHSKVLTAGCILGGLIEEDDIHISYGQEPCKKIYRFYEKDKSRTNQLNMNKSYKCPFYYQCPMTKQQSDIFSANVIVTTTAALSTMSIGLSGMTLFQYTLEYADLVIVDEAERELQKLDEIFAPYIPFDEYIRKNGKVAADYYKKTLDERTQTNENIRHFISLHQRSENVFARMDQLLRSERHGFARSKLRRPFSGKILIDECRRRKLLPEELCDDLAQMINLKRDPIYMAILSDLQEVKTKRGLEESFDIGWGTKKDLTEVQVNRVIFIGAVLYFEYLYRELSHLVEADTILPNSTKEILSQRFEFHQRYLPVSPIGNIFGLQYKDSDANGKADLYIVKQFALGRAMYVRFPWLKLDVKGDPAGPHVMFLSGSSFAPGSLANHVNEPVNYIIEAEQYKRDFIRRTHFEYIRTEVSVSGSSNEKRHSRLQELVTTCKELIEEKMDQKKNILMIVNSYEDGEAILRSLKDKLKDCDGKDKIANLVPEEDNSETLENVKQSQVNRLRKTGARLLIAPAILIERGHNIVDEKGNAYFDVLIFMTRPMQRPDDYKTQVTKVNGYIMAKYSNKHKWVNINHYNDMGKDAFSTYHLLRKERYHLSSLDSFLQKDIVSTLFVMILQIFGRLCRIGAAEDMKSETPEVYFADAAFKSRGRNQFDLLNRMVIYLDDIIHGENVENEIAKTLYEPFYEALKKGKHIYDEQKKLYSSSVN